MKMTKELQNQGPQVFHERDLSKMTETSLQVSNVTGPSSQSKNGGVAPNNNKDNSGDERDVVTPHSEKVEVSLCELRRIQSCDEFQNETPVVDDLLDSRPKSEGGNDTEREDALEGLSELVPDLVDRKANAVVGLSPEAEFIDEQEQNIRNLDSMVAMLGMSKDQGSDNDAIAQLQGLITDVVDEEDVTSSCESSSDGSPLDVNNNNGEQGANQASAGMAILSKESTSSSSSGSTLAHTHASSVGRLEEVIDVEDGIAPVELPQQTTYSSPSPYHRKDKNNPNTNKASVSNQAQNNTRTHPYGPSRPDSPPTSHRRELSNNVHSSSATLSTATHTAASISTVRMPMYLPNFRPATGCTNASDFIVRCFVARLRSGITVVKHGRNRWCKSRLRILHIHSDGKCLSWKPAQGEPSTSKRPPRLDLTTCIEVRHAWTPDPQNPMFTGTPLLRQKCEASNAFKSFALIFGRRTVDITAVTADQCKVLMEGFSALCFRLQVAHNNEIGDNNNNNNITKNVEGDDGSDEEKKPTATVSTEPIFGR